MENEYQFLDRRFEMKTRHSLITWLTFCFFTGMAVTLTGLVLIHYEFRAPVLLLFIFIFVLPIRYTLLLVQQHQAKKLMLRSDGIERWINGRASVLKWADVTRVAETGRFEGGILLRFPMPQPQWRFMTTKSR